jgi:hypothetical protein
MNRLAKLQEHVQKKPLSGPPPSGVRRRAGAMNLAPRYTFKNDRVAAMRSFLEGNASGSPMSCIATMNEALRRLFDRTDLTLKSEVHTTMEALRAVGLATERRVIEFLDASNKETKGVKRPDHLPVKIVDAMMDLATYEVGWSVFGLSLMDGYHSVLITLDNNDPGPIGGEKPPKVYWSDQWPSKGGWKEYSVDGLDTEVTRLVQGWWDGQPEGKKHKTRISIWRVLGPGA